MQDRSLAKVSSRSKDPTMLESILHYGAGFVLDHNSLQAATSYELWRLYWLCSVPLVFRQGIGFRV